MTRVLPIAVLVAFATFSAAFAIIAPIGEKCGLVLRHGQEPVTGGASALSDQVRTPPSIVTPGLDPAIHGPPGQARG